MRPFPHKPSRRNFPSIDPTFLPRIENELILQISLRPFSRIEIVSMSTLIEDSLRYFSSRVGSIFFQSYIVCRLLRLTCDNRSAPLKKSPLSFRFFLEKDLSLSEVVRERLSSFLCFSEISCIHSLGLSCCRFPEALPPFLSFQQVRSISQLFFLPVNGRFLGDVSPSAELFFFSFRGGF